MVKKLYGVTAITKNQIKKTVFNAVSELLK